MDEKDDHLERAFLLASDPAGVNQALFLVTHGLYILTAARQSRLNGQCLDALMQVTNMPPRVAVGVNQRSLTHEMIGATGHFGVNVLDRENPQILDLIKHFGFQSGRTIDKFATLPYLRARSGVPIRPDAKAFYTCQVLPEMTLDLGTHTLFIGSVEQAGTREKGEPLTYNEYRVTMRGRSER